MRVLDIGGGDKADYWGGAQQNGDYYINIDARKVDKVDVVHDLNVLPLPFPDNDFDKVMSRYCLEHISWRIIPYFVKEIYRVLKVGGRCYILTSNLQAQAGILARTKEFSWNNDVCMIFGDLDYAENSHRGSMSAELAERTFKEAGFKWVVSYPFWQWYPDLVVECGK